MSAVTRNLQRWTFLFLGLVFAAGAVVPVAAQSANPVTAAFVASTATAIPGGTGNFTRLALLASNPQLNGQAVAFIGLGTEGQQGIYVALIGSPTGGFPGGVLRGLGHRIPFWPGRRKSID